MITRRVNKPLIMPHLHQHVQLFRHPALANVVAAQRQHEVGREGGDACLLGCLGAAAERSRVVVVKQLGGNQAFQTGGEGHLGSKGERKGQRGVCNVFCKPYVAEW